MKRERKLPKQWQGVSNWQGACPAHDFTKLGDVKITDSIVGISKYSESSTAPGYSDADLELIIARLKVARESVNAEVEKYLELFGQILAAGRELAQEANR